MLEKCWLTKDEEKKGEDGERNDDEDENKSSSEEERDESDATNSLPKKKTKITAHNEESDEESLVVDQLAPSNALVDGATQKRAVIEKKCVVGSFMVLVANMKPPKSVCLLKDFDCVFVA